MIHPAPSEAEKVGIVGMGAVGSGWAALMLAKGLSVKAFDPAEGSELRAAAMIAASWPSLTRLGLSDLAEPPLAGLSFCDTVETAVDGVDVVLENTPEDFAVKQKTIRRIDAATSPSTPILSSAGGIPPSDLQKSCRHPQRVLVMHPFNPSHLIPLVEIVPGSKTARETTEWTRAFARHLGKTPITINRERAGHMVNRLQFALVREAISCLVDGVASAEDIDGAVRFGLAPRWLLAGGLQTVALAGGAGGMKGILDHAGAAMEQWWRPTAGLKLSGDVREQLIAAAEQLSCQADYSEWSAWRDQHLVSLIGLQAAAETVRPGHDKGSTP